MLFMLKWNNLTRLSAFQFVENIQSQKRSLMTSLDTETDSKPMIIITLLHSSLKGCEWSLKSQYSLLCTLICYTCLNEQRSLRKAFRKGFVWLNSFILFNITSQHCHLCTDHNFYYVVHTAVCMKINNKFIFTFWSTKRNNSAMTDHVIRCIAKVHATKYTLGAWPCAYHRCML